MHHVRISCAIPYDNTWPCSTFFGCCVHTTFYTFTGKGLHTKRTLTGCYNRTMLTYDVMHSSILHTPFLGSSMCIITYNNYDNKQNGNNYVLYT